MQDLLKQNNIALRYEIEKLQRSLKEEQAKIPVELKSYAAWVINECANFHRDVLDNIQLLESKQENLLKDILSKTQSIANAFSFLNQHQASPILRARNSDRLSLKLLLWLHGTHLKRKIFRWRWVMAFSAFGRLNPVFTLRPVQHNKD